MRKPKNTAAIYLRLSRDDGSDAESNSIVTQRMMLQKYAKEHGFQVYDEYSDDGWSGTSFERPSFKRMINDIEEGKIGIVLCKDLSRLGRNNAMVAYYTEIVFPDNDVRFIAVNDAIDTALGDSGGNAVMPFMSVVNEYYARDISKKVRSAKRTRALNGEHSNGRAPFGYIKNPNEKNKLIVDEETAPILQRIFQMCADGFGNYQIANILTKDRIKNPSAYIFERTGKSYGCFYDPEFPYEWRAETVVAILKNQVYLGHMVNHKQTVKSFKNKKVVNVPKEDWIIVENTHTPLISQELFDKVQSLLKVKKRSNKRNEANIYAGLLKCHDCGKGLSLVTAAVPTQKRNVFYNCSSYRHGTRTVEFSRCTPHHISRVALDEIVRLYIKKAVSATLDVDAFLENIANSEEDKSADNKAKARLEKREKELKVLVKRVFEQNALGKIDDSTFTELYTSYQNELKDIKERLEKAETAIAKKSDKEAIARLFAEAVQKYTQADELSREMLVDLIEKIVVHEHTGPRQGKERKQVVEIYFRFIGKLD